ncbi:FAD-binding oxidoreductase [Marinobacter alkaliphilus]|uniref:FAD-binding oxidoreductase n=1 Tax=Marinobacter alkaliphilus TaxID=254719 RepID=A0ABZ3E0U4_9GAMM
MKTPSSWNRVPDIAPEAICAVTDRAATIPKRLPRPLLPYGNGRSYGDVCLTDKGTLILTRGLDRFIEFDPLQGRLRCEAGITLGEILALVVPQGWFLASTPGTQFATIGGAVANDVHGKNHHDLGCFGHHVMALELLRSDGEVIYCSPETNPQWLYSTIGGLGLTGLIRWVDVQLKPILNPWMRVQSQRFANLDEFWTMSQEVEAYWPYTVAWIDCLASGESRGRGILLTGDHAPAQSQPIGYRPREKRMLIDPPFSMINHFTLKTFNALYYRQPVRPQGTLTHYTPFFYPLDAIQNWNRIYGKKGFFQYQCVIPPENAQAAIADLLDTIARHSDGSFLAVLKMFGNKKSVGMLSFPRPGATLALDFPNRGSRTLNLLSALDDIVRSAKGALYPAKDARMPADLFQSGYPAWQDFSRFVDPHFSSSFWRRVTL